MRNMLKKVLRAMWRATSPIRRPLQRKFETYLAGMLGQLIEAQMPAITNRLQAAVGASAYDSNLVLNSLVREIARLQMQVEILQQYAEDAHDARQLQNGADAEPNVFHASDHERAQVA
jgi:hypothetical protein